MAHTENYIAKTGQEAKSRLTLQHEVFLEGTKQALKMAEFNPHMKICVVGCGCGDETLYIADKLSDDGSVIGLDISPNQIEQAIQAAKIQSYTNVNFYVQDILQTNEAYHNNFDLIFCRFVIPHLKNPLQAINNMKNYLKCGGKLVSQEPIISHCWSEPKSPAFEQYKLLMLEWAKNLGLDFDMAITIPELFKRSGLTAIQEARWQPRVISPEQKIMVTMSAQECAPAIISQNLITREEMDKLIEDMKHEVVDSHAILFQCENVLVSGMKPSH